MYIIQLVILIAWHKPKYPFARHMLEERSEVSTIKAVLVFYNDQSSMVGANYFSPLILWANQIKL